MRVWQKLSQLPSLTELNFSNCPVCRKQLYRPTLIKKFPALRLLDAKDVTLEERERTEVRSPDRPPPDCWLIATMMLSLLLALPQLLFSSEPRNSPTFATDSKYVLSTKVPIKLTSMNFEALTVRQPPVPIPGEGQMMVAVGPGGERQQVPADWHQYSNTPEESVRALPALPWHRAPLCAAFSCSSTDGLRAQVRSMLGRHKLGRRGAEGPAPSAGDVLGGEHGGRPSSREGASRGANGGRRFR